MLGPLAFFSKQKLIEALRTEWLIWLQKKRMPSDTNSTSTFLRPKSFLCFCPNFARNQQIRGIMGPLEEEGYNSSLVFSLKSRVKWPMTPVIHLFSAIYNWCLQHLPVESRPTNNHPGLRRLRRRRLIAQSLLKRLVQKTPLDPFGGWISWSQKMVGTRLLQGIPHKSADDLLRDSFQIILSFKLQWYTYSCTFILGCLKGGGRSTSITMAWISIMGPLGV